MFYEEIKWNSERISNIKLFIIIHVSKINWNCEKTSNSISSSKRKRIRMELFCSKKTIYIIKRNNSKTSWWFIIIIAWIAFIPLGQKIMPYIIYADIESLIKKVDGYANNPENSWTTKIGIIVIIQVNIETEHIAFVI